jgi:alpha-tubulin suppressor-like RCC1 family protein
MAAGVCYFLSRQAGEPCLPALPQAMRPIKCLFSPVIPAVVGLAVFGLVSVAAQAATVDAIYNSAADVPVAASGYTATGNTVSFTLNFAPATGTDLMVVNNTGLGFIAGTFDNLAQGQLVVLSYGGVSYAFMANYYGGSGNDLVLVWANTRAFAWGANNVGQLGDGSTFSLRAAPVAVNTTATPAALFGKTVLGLAAGEASTLAFCADGTVAAWGDNEAGALGNSNYFDTSVPVNVNTAPGVSALSGKTVVAVAAGSAYVLALCSDGTVAAWGDDGFGELGDNREAGFMSLVPLPVNTSLGSALYGRTVVAVAAGGWHNLALCSDGNVAAWGWNQYGQLGDTTTTDRYLPVAVNTNSGVSALFGKTVVAVAAGHSHSLALCSDGTVAAWGNNSDGELGDNTTTNRSVPVAVNTDSGVSALSGRTVVAIAAGLQHSLALCTDGTVAAWGYNSDGELGDNTSTKRLVPVAVNTNSGVSALFGKTVVAIAAGAYQSLTLCSDATSAAWGWNSDGQLGDGTRTTRLVPVVVNASQLSAGQRFTRVTSGCFANHSLALVAAPPASTITLASAGKLTNGPFQFSFTNTPGAFFGVLATTNSLLPLSSWTPLTGPTEALPGQFQFTDAQATNTPQRFYRVRSP